jgi:hypothetical protein
MEKYQALINGWKRQMKEIQVRQLIKFEQGAASVKS